jgi:hypothetical protein
LLRFARNDAERRDKPGADEESGSNWSRWA